MDFGPGGVVGFEPDDPGEARHGVGRGAGKRLGLRNGGPFATMRFGKQHDTGVIMVSSPNAHRRAVSEGHGDRKNNTPQESESEGENAVQTSTPTTTLTAGGPTPRTTKEYSFESNSRDSNNCVEFSNDDNDDNDNENNDDSMMEPIRPTRAAVNIAIPSPSATPAPIPKADISIGGVSSGGEESYNGLALTSSDDTAPMAERTVSGGSGPSDGAPSLRARRAARWHGGQPFAGGPPSESSLSTSPHMSLKPTTSASSAGGGGGAGVSSRRSPVLGQDSQFRGPSIGTTLAATNTNVSTYTTNTTKSPTLGSTNGSFGAQSASNGTSGVAAGLLSHLKAPAAAILPLSKGAAMKDVQVNARFYGDADVRAKLRLLASDIDFDDIVDHGFPQIRLSGGSHGSHGDAASDDGARSFEFRDHSSAGSLAGLSDDYGSSGASAISYVTVPGARRDMTLKMTLTPSTMRADEETLYGWQKEQFDGHAPPTPTTPTSLAASDLRDSDDNVPPIPPMPDNISVGPGRDSHDAPSVHGNEGVSEFIPVGGLGGNNSSRRIKNVFGGLRKKNQRQPPANAYMITSSSAN